MSTTSVLNKLRDRVTRAQTKSLRQHGKLIRNQFTRVAVQFVHWYGKPIALPEMTKVEVTDETLVVTYVIIPSGKYFLSPALHYPNGTLTELGAEAGIDLLWEGGGSVLMDAEIMTKATEAYGAYRRLHAPPPEFVPEAPVTVEAGTPKSTTATPEIDPKTTTVADVLSGKVKFDLGIKGLVENARQLTKADEALLKQTGDEMEAKRVISTGGAGIERYAFNEREPKAPSVNMVMPPIGSAHIAGEPVVWSNDEAMPAKVRKRLTERQRLLAERDADAQQARDHVARLADLPMALRGAGTVDEWAELRFEQLTLCNVPAVKAIEMTVRDVQGGCLGMVR